jgi:transcriptional regulator with XRE-family HTH domain
MSEGLDYQTALGVAIKDERERRELSEATVAARVGVKEQWLIKVEAGRGNPTWGQLRRLADAMEIPLPELMERIERCEEGRSSPGERGQGPANRGRKRREGGAKPEVRPQEALAKALSHPMRAQALTILVERTASPKEIADELDETLPNVSYHVRVLEELGLVELVEEEAIRGSVAHFYRAVEQDIGNPAWKWSPLLLDEEGWRKIVEIQDSALKAMRKEQAAAQRRLKGSRRRRVRGIFGLLLFKTALH